MASGKLTAAQKEAVLAHLRGQKAPAGASAAELIRWQEAYLGAKVPSTSGRLAALVEAPVEILRDEWGMPHIFAQTAHDLFLGYGLAMAQDRLFQMDYYRHAAYGRLSELVGERGLKNDLTARTLDSASTARAEMENLSAEAREALEAYAEGVNLAIEAFGDELPFEFDLLGYKPEPWKPEDNLTMHRASLWEYGGRIESLVMAEAAQRVLPPTLAQWILGAEHGDLPICQMPLGEKQGDASLPGGGGDGDTGSNNWAVSASRSATGAALLASDGHIAYTQPATNYEIHLCGAGYNFTGIVWASRFMPLNGRNGSVAWGLTNNNTSTRDLYVEEVHPDDPKLYRNGDQWLPFQERQERILVRGAEPVEITVRSAVRGPVVNALIPSVAEGGDPPLSLHWIGAEPCDSITVGLKLVRARDAAEYRALLSGWHLTVYNPGFVDDLGRSAVQIEGRVPIRGRLVLGFRQANNPADDWQGFIPYQNNPYEFDPSKGWIASANNRPAPPGYPWPFYGNYADGYRMNRIVDRLSSKDRHTLQDMGDIQMDVYLERAAETTPSIIQHLADTAAKDRKIAQAIEYLEKWDYYFTTQAIAPSIYSAFWEAWHPKVLAARIPAHLRKVGFRTLPSTELLTKGDIHGWFPPGHSVRGEVLATMQEALAWLNEHLGPDMACWQWGKLHPLTFRHYLSATPERDETTFAQAANVGPYPCAGTSGTLNNAGYAIGQLYQVTGGPHFRFLVDMAQPRIAWGCNSTGNSGHPGSPHYRDQIEDWLAGRYHPMYMDRKDIEAHLEGIAILEPRR